MILTRPPHQWFFSWTCMRSEEVDWTWSQRKLSTSWAETRPPWSTMMWFLTEERGRPGTFPPSRGSLWTPTSPFALSHGRTALHLPPGQKMDTMMCLRSEKLRWVVFDLNHIFRKVWWKYQHKYRIGTIRNVRKKQPNSSYYSTLKHSQSFINSPWKYRWHHTPGAWTDIYNFKDLCSIFPEDGAVHMKDFLPRAGEKQVDATVLVWVTKRTSGNVTRLSIVFSLKSTR